MDIPLLLRYLIEQRSFFLDLFLLIVFTFIMTLVMVAILIKQWILFHLQEFTTPQ